jgi:hypothetical protein
MIKSRESLEKELTTVLKKNINRRNIQSVWVKETIRKYEMPEILSSDYITMRKDLVDASTFALFIIADVIKPELISQYFASKEIKALSKEKWNIEKISFPLKYHMVQISEDQFIGKISVKDLMLLRNAQLIKYNENTQRTMQHIVKGKTELFKISLNKSAVYNIINSYESDLYIPNTITLNMPDDAEYYYDEENSLLEITNLDYFDMLDGYHRYIALSKIFNKNPEFDYEMELRIVQFEESKAKRFIWQEDQKTKMRKIDSESMDTSKASNKIVERLNMNCCELGGKISRNKGIINAANLANIIDVVMLKDVKKADERLAIRNISSDITGIFDFYTTERPELAKKPWTKLFAYVLIYEIRYGNPNDIESFYKDLHKVEEDGSIYTNTNLTTADVTRTHKLLRREGY